MLHRLQLHSSQIARRGAYALGIQTRTFKITSAQRAFRGPEVYLPDSKIETTPATSGITEDETLLDSQSSAKEYVSSTVLNSERHYDVAGGLRDSSQEQETVANPPGGETSSTSSSYAHPVLTQKAARFEGGVGSSSSVRYRGAPGEMRPGSYGGASLSQGVNATENQLEERNPQPYAGFGRSGIHEAWKDRK